MRESVFHTPEGLTVPSVSAAEMKQIDRIAINDFGLQLLQMMENAGRNLAAHAQLLHKTGPITIIAGAGGNGGGGLACARHLANREVSVTVVLDRVPGALTGAVATQLGILQATDTPITTSPEPISDATFLIDALIGYGLGDAPRDGAKDLINRCNDTNVGLLSLDIPSGYDATTGDTPGVAMNPDQTLTLALPKHGLHTVPGELYVADISIPKAVYRRLNIEYVTPFTNEYWVELQSNPQS